MTEHLTVTITGHRPEGLGDIEWVRVKLAEVLTSIQASHLIQGMAAGADLLSAEVAYALHIPYTSAKPWKGHSARVEDLDLYKGILQRSERVVNVSDSLTYTGPQLYHARNEWMVDNGDVVVAIWNGQNKGGTAAAVRYTRKVGKPLICINPVKQTVDWGDTGLDPDEGIPDLTLF